ncbi:protein unc-45 homolog B isoform X1 [Marmota monax]|uniref:protein unc-45 homolog B isoform X1 n=1 Tax=Marmota monax TaxID=9995 RepID=UPI001EB05880|nr:protein unc-45 homolog B isoform X1 [Marmota monax]
MFEILLDQNSDADKLEKAANNLIVLGREDAGAEGIFQNNGVALLLQLLDTKRPELVLAAVRTLSGMCSGHRARATAILHAVGIDRICGLMSVENEEMALAVCNLLQPIIDSLSGEDKWEHRGKEEALVLVSLDLCQSLPGSEER